MARLVSRVYPIISPGAVRTVTGSGWDSGDHYCVSLEQLRCDSTMLLATIILNQ